MKTNLEEEDKSQAVKESIHGKVVETTTTTTTTGEDNNGLQDSEVTSPTDPGSFSEEEGGFGGGWLGGITADFRTLAVSIKETAGDVVGFVHRSALSVAAEIAQMERGENEGLEHDYRGDDVYEPLRLPWEISNEEGEYTEDANLKGKVLRLSLDEKNFLKPFPQPDKSLEEQALLLSEPRIFMIRRLLEIDNNLASTHARLSGRSHVREAIFWRNYFFHCEQVRNDHVQQFWVQKMQTQESNKAAALSSVRSSDSLIPDDDELDDDTSTQTDSSYVRVNASAPTSMNSVSVLQSLDEDMVLVDASFISSPDRKKQY